jgi:hypothetical protein
LSRVAQTPEKLSLFERERVSKTELPNVFAEFR